MLITLIFSIYFSPTGNVFISPVLEGEKQHEKGEATVLQKHLIIYLYTERELKISSFFKFIYILSPCLKLSSTKFDFSYLIICLCQNVHP